MVIDSTNAEQKFQDAVNSINGTLNELIAVISQLVEASNATSTAMAQLMRAITDSNAQLEDVASSDDEDPNKTVDNESKELPQP